MKKSGVLISSHRGTRVHAIENTKAAFEYCLLNRLDYIEFDVRRTIDNVIVVFHDKSVDKLLNGTGNVEKMVFADLNDLSYADGQRVLTLEEFFSLVGKKIRPMLEIKSRNISDQVIELVHKFGYSGDEILIQSFNFDDIHECYRLDLQYDYGLCVGSFLKFPFLRSLSAKLYYSTVLKSRPYVKWVNANGINLYDEMAQVLTNHGVQIILGAKNTRKFLSKLVPWNVKIVNCDDATAIRKLLG